jgi:hypothetical protein
MENIKKLQTIKLIFLISILVLGLYLITKSEPKTDCSKFQVSPAIISYLPDISPGVITTSHISMSRRPYTRQASSSNIYNITVTGPMLGSMDNPEVRGTVSCGPSGIILTGTITRSAAYNGSVLQNIAWHPKAQFTVISNGRGVNIVARWLLVSGNGHELNFDLNSLGQFFPYTVSKFVLFQ